jgi:hypothetical protein
LRHIFSPRDNVYPSLPESSKLVMITLLFFFSKEVLYGVQRCLWVVALERVRELQSRCFSG